jgi:pyridoxamine 5'-phosphate oxidase
MKFDRHPSVGERPADDGLAHPLSSSTPPLHAIRREYGDTPLEPGDLDPDPIVQFERWFADACAAEILEPNAMTLATVDETGAPDARIVLLKHLSADGFVLYTDYDSAKGRQLAEHGVAALVFFWDRLQRQVRVTGTVERLPAELSDAYFASRPVKSRIAAVASRQSRVVESRLELESSFADIARRFEGEGDLPRPETWGGFLVRPRVIEFWQGRRSRLHDRLRYTRAVSGDWKIARLAP